MKSSDDTEWIKERFVCIGYARLRDGSLGVGLIQLDEKGKPIGEERWFSSTKLRRFHAGLVYLVEQQENAIRSQTAQYLERFEDREAIAKWELRSESEKLVYRAAMKEKQFKANAELLRILRPLRKVYNRLPFGAQETAYELVVLRALRTPLSKEEKEEEEE